MPLLAAMRLRTLLWIRHYTPAGFGTTPLPALLIRYCKNPIVGSALHSSRLRHYEPASFTYSPTSGTLSRGRHFTPAGFGTTTLPASRTPLLQALYRGDSTTLLPALALRPCLLHVFPYFRHSIEGPALHPCWLWHYAPAIFTYYPTSGTLSRGRHYTPACFMYSPTSGTLSRVRHYTPAAFGTTPLPASRFVHVCTIAFSSSKAGFGTMPLPALLPPLLQAPYRGDKQAKHPTDAAAPVFIFALGGAGFVHFCTIAVSSPKACFSTTPLLDLLTPLLQAPYRGDKQANHPTDAAAPVLIWLWAAQASYMSVQ
eukprot:gene14571-20614_t